MASAPPLFATVRKKLMHSVIGFTHPIFIKLNHCASPKPGRIEAGIKAFEKMGGRLIGFYVVTGEYDYIIIGEATSDEVATTFSLLLASIGNVRTTSLRAYTKEEFAAMANKLP